MSTNWPGVDDADFARLLDAALASLTKTQAEVMREMLAAFQQERLEDAEIVQCGLRAFLGTRPVSARTVHALLRACCITSNDPMDARGTRYYHLTSTGAEMLRRYESSRA